MSDQDTPLSKAPDFLDEDMRLDIPHEVSSHVFSHPYNSIHN